MDDYGKATGAPSHVTLGGVSYAVAKMGPRIYGELSQFLKGHIPDPRLKAAAILRELPDNAALKDVALQIWRDLCDEARDWPPTLDSGEGNYILCTTLEGAAAVVWALLRRHNASLTESKAREIADDLTVEDVSRLLNLSMPELSFDPKSPPAPTTTEDRGPVPA